MSILDELEEIAGPTSRLSKRAHKKGRGNKTRNVNGVEERFCYVCKQWKSNDNFYSRRSPGIEKSIVVGYQACCKPCSCKHGSRGWKIKKQKRGFT